MGVSSLAFAAATLIALATTIKAADAPQQNGNPIFNNMKLFGNPIFNDMKVLKTGQLTANKEADVSCENEINAQCGGSWKKCCDNLVCSPVLDMESHKVSPRCIVKDPSLLDPNVCYDEGEQCFFNHQCCSGFCQDSDGDTHFMCEPGTTLEHMNPVSTTSPLTISQNDKTEQIAVLEEEPENDHYGTTSKKLPVASTILLAVTLFAVLAFVTFKFITYRQVPGVDKIPEQRYQEDSEYHITTKICIKNDPAENEAEVPPVPPRDYNYH